MVKMDKLPENANRKKGFFEMGNHSHDPFWVLLLNFYIPVGVDSSETSGRHGPRMPVENFYKAMSSTPIVMGMAAAKVKPASMDRARSLPFSCLLAPPKIHFAPHCGRSDLVPADGVLMRRSCLLN